MSDHDNHGHKASSKGVDYHKIDNHGGGHGGAAHAEEGEGPWLMSFADMVTLLMCFFILFFSTDKGNIKLQNPEELMARLEALQKVLGTKAEDDMRAPPTSETRTPTGAYGSIDSFKKDMTKLSRDLDLVFTVGTPQPGEIEMTFLNVRFFASGEAALTQEGEGMLKAVAMKLGQLDENATIEVEGHTDSDPIKSNVYPSNWELSGSRAATVVRYLQGFGIRPERLRASGMAHYRPIAPEVDKEGHRLPQNKALNRRIVLHVRLPDLIESKANPDSNKSKIPKETRGAKQPNDAKNQREAKPR